MNKDYMLRMKPKVNGVSSPVKSAIGNGFEASVAMEVKPCGMLVQKRNSDSNHVSNINVKVKYGSSYHEIIISSQASFGELKKVLASVTGLNSQDQKLIYKEKERDSNKFLDIVGVKNGSKIVLIEDELRKEKRLLESRKNATLDKASKDIATIRLEIDKLAKQVATAEHEIHGGKKVVETTLLSLIELLMAQLIKLDGVAADGDVKLQRRMQVKRVQKYIETLDMLKMKNAGLGKAPLQKQHQYKMFTGQVPVNFHNQQVQRNQNVTEKVNPGPVVVTTKWETF